MDKQLYLEDRLAQILVTLKQTPSNAVKFKTFVVEEMKMVPMTLQLMMKLKKKKKKKKKKKLKYLHSSSQPLSSQLLLHAPYVLEV